MEPEETKENSITEEPCSYTIISFTGSDLPESYKGLVYSRWLRSHRYGNFIFKMIPSDIYYNQYGMHISQLIANPKCEVKIAVLTDDHDVVLGFSVNRGTNLDYVHVHYVQRGQRIASHLVPKDIKFITHWTYMGERFATKRYGGYVFNPYA
jgi:hypothetical protein